MEKQHIFLQDLDHDFIKHFGNWCQRLFKQQSCTAAAHGYSLYITLILCMSYRLNPLTHKNLGRNEHCGCWSVIMLMPWMPSMYCWPYTGLPSVTEFQYFVTEITLLLLKFSLNFGPNTEIYCNFSVVCTQKYWNLCRIMQRYWNCLNLLLKWVSRGWQPWMPVTLDQFQTKINLQWTTFMTLESKIQFWKKK